MRRQRVLAARIVSCKTRNASTRAVLHIPHKSQLDHHGSKRSRQVSEGLRLYRQIKSGFPRQDFASARLRPQNLSAVGEEMAELGDILLVFAEGDTQHFAKGLARNAGGHVQGWILRLRSARARFHASKKDRRRIPEAVRAASVDGVARRCILPLCLPSVGRLERRPSRRRQMISPAGRGLFFARRNGVTSRTTTFPAEWRQTPWRLRRSSVQGRRWSPCRSGIFRDARGGGLRRRRLRPCPPSKR